MRDLVGNPKSTARQVRSECSLDNEVSVDAVHKVLQKKNNLNGGTAAKSPSLTKNLGIKD